MAEENLATSSPNLRAALSFLSIADTLDPAPLETLLSPSYTHTLAPSSLTGFGPWDKAGFMAHISFMGSVLEGFPVKVVEAVESERSVWAWTRSQARWHAAAMDKDGEDTGKEWDFKGENLFMLWFDAQGKIERCVEMMDSLRSVNVFIPLLERATANVSNAS
ncbi:unnamed protein product [Periconia digitata]|uniref:SnoaL-like domain-containing protein n=1 Tax=Periconia digitata TaxID=1303443 RepID=A0A9W4U1Q2_9PLEO|nr:unnamed protein product [Periconia digitata]